MSDFIEQYVSFLWVALMVSSLAFLYFYFVCFWLLMEVNREDRTEGLANFALFGLFIPPLGALVGIYYKFIHKKLWEAEMQEEVEAFLSLTNKEVVEIIDDMANETLYTSNHSWVRDTWSKLNDRDRESWVEGRRSFLNESFNPRLSSGEFVQLFAKADRKYKRAA